MKTAFISRTEFFSQSTIPFVRVRYSVNCFPCLHFSAIPRHDPIFVKTQSHLCPECVSEHSHFIYLKEITETLFYWFNADFRKLKLTCECRLLLAGSERCTIFRCNKRYFVRLIIRNWRRIMLVSFDMYVQIRIFCINNRCAITSKASQIVKCRVFHPGMTRL